MREQLRQRLKGQLAQPLTLAAQPLLERGLVDCNACQQVTTVEPTRPLEDLRRPARHERLEFGDVDVHRLAVERDRVALQYEGRRRCWHQHLAQPKQRLAQAITRRFLPDAAPQQRRQLPAWVCFSDRYREICEQRLALLHRQGDGPARLQPGLQAPKEGETQPRHRTPISEIASS